MSFHDDFALELYQSKQFPHMRIVLSNSKSGSFTPVLNLNDEEKQEWLSENFISMGLISPERFRENLEWIDKHLSEKTRLVLMTDQNMIISGTKNLITKNFVCRSYV